MTGSHVALVTGGNRGIGLDVCRLLASRNCLVVMGARDLAAGLASVELLKTEGLHAVPVRLDVTDSASIESAARQVEVQFGRLDLLINNAGVLFEADFAREVASVEDYFLKPSEVPLDVVKRTFDVNVFGAIAVTSAFLPLLRRSADARIVSVSSRLASLASAARIAATAPSPTPRGQDPEYLNLLAYNSSKAALNAAMLQFMIELRDSRIRIDILDPGHCATDINHHSGNRTPREAAEAILNVAFEANHDPGHFWHKDGEHPW